MTPKIVRWLKVGVGFAVSLACIAFILTRIDVDALWITLEKFQWPFLVAALVSLAVDYTLRIVRWSVMLRAAGGQVTAGACVPAFLGSMALNNVLPLRAGDVVRALVFPASLGVKRTTATASLVLERLFDLMTLLAFLAVGLSLSPSIHISTGQKEALIALAVIGAVLLIGLIVLSRRVASFFGSWSICAKQRDYPRIASMLTHAKELIGSFSAMSGMRVFFSLTVFSMLVWLANTGLYLAVLHGFSIAASSSAALAVMAIATLSTLVPSSPGYAGPFHLATYAAVTMMGGDAAQAASFALVSHLALWVPVTIAGFIAIAMTPEMFRKPDRSDTEPK